MSYEHFSRQFRQLFDEIGRGDRAREAGRHLPIIPLERLRDAGLGAITVPRDDPDQHPVANFETVLRLMMDLATEDVNVAHMWRSHVVFIEYLRAVSTPAEMRRWWQRLDVGEWGGSALSATMEQVAQPTTVRADEVGNLTVSGTKYYSTGTLASTWTLVGVERDHDLALKRARQRRRHGESGVRVEDCLPAMAVVAVKQPRVRVRDDWDGFGQRLTATGSLIMKDALAEAVYDRPDNSRRGILNVMLEVTLLALQAGIARAALRDGMTALQQRTRVFNTSTGSVPREDDQLLGIIGELSAKSALCEQSVRAVGAQLDEVIAAGDGSDDGSDDGTGEGTEEGAGEGAASGSGWVETLVASQRAAITVPSLALEVCTGIFDVLGASATSTDLALDRHWRNARTLATHDPSVFKARMVGNWEVNGVVPSTYLAQNR